MAKVVNADGNQEKLNMFIEIDIKNFSEIIITGVSMLVILGHNLWLVAKDEPDEIKIEVVTSDKFPESDSAVKPERIKDFRGFFGNESFEIKDFETAENSLVARLKNKKTELAELELYPHLIVIEIKLCDSNSVEIFRSAII